MSDIPLISQGDGFVYNSMITGMGAAYPTFTWPGPNVWVPVPFNSAMPGSGPPPNQYMTADGGFQPPIAGWWQIILNARAYAGFGSFSHWAGLFRNEIGNDSLVLKAGGFQVVQANAIINLYLNGTDTLYMAFLTTKTGVSTRSMNASQTFLQAHYIRP